MILTQEDLELLKQLKAVGERGRTIHVPSIRTRLARLVRGGYVVDRGLVVYRITQRGQDAVAEHAA